MKRRENFDTDTAKTVVFNRFEGEHKPPNYEKTYHSRSRFRSLRLPDDFLFVAVFDHHYDDP